MQFRELELKKYKAFRNQTRLEIAPLTILVGANNSGKTALAQAIHFLSSNLSIPDGDNRESLRLNSGGIRYGNTFEDLISGRSIHGELSLSVVLENSGSEVTFKVKVQNVVRPYKPSESEQQISHWSLRDGEVWFEATNTNLRESSAYRVSVSGADQPEQQIHWRGLLPHSPDQFPGWVTKQVDAIRAWASGIRYLECPRSFPSSGLKIGEGYAKDANTPLITLSTDDTLLDSVRKWYRSVFGVSLDIRRQGDYFDLMVESQHAYGTSVLLEQSGEGLSQVLPVAIMALTAKQQGTGVDIIEHPEADLHPAAHAGVAELLLHNLPGPKRPVIIETHSEMILLRVRRWIAEGRLPSDNVLVYWIDTKPDCGTILQKITINNRGAMDAWPEGVFIEDYEEVLAIRRAVHEGKE